MLQGHSPREESKRQLKAVHRERNDPDKVLAPLESICVSLVMGAERYLRGFDADAAIPMLVHMTEKEQFAFRGDAMARLFRAISLTMEYVPSSYEGVAPFYKRLMKSVCQVLSRTLAGKMKYSNTDNVMLLEESLRLIRFISKDEHSAYLLHFGVSDVIRIAASENTLLARQAFDVLVVVCSKLILPSELEKTSFFRISFLFTGGKKRKSHKDALPSSDKPIVVAVEDVLVPFLHASLQQYAASLESFPEAWSFLEMVMQCLGMIMQRALLCHRPSTARKVVTHELCRTLFQLLLFNDNNVALDHTVRSERLLFCETMLAVAMAADSAVANESLLTEEAQTFYKLMFGESDAEITTLLDDPFPRGVVSSRNTHRRDKNHIASIAAIRLFVLACPRVPSEAFGPKPKFLLPVHQWAWEDEMRHSNDINEDGCAVLETTYARLSREATLKIRVKDMTVDLHLMKMSSGFGSGDRNVSRKFVPFVFHFVDESKVCPGKAAKGMVSSKKLAVEGKQKTKTTTAASSSSSSMPLTTRGSSGLNHLYIMNKDAPASPVYMSIAEMYLEALCNFVVWVSGQMAMQLGVCACASLLQAAIRSGEDQRLLTLLSRIIRPLCEMAREALVSADKATKSVALTMLVWLLRHPHAPKWNFATTAQRCGLLNQLEILARGGGGGGGSSCRGAPGVAASQGGVVEAPQTRTEYLAGAAAVLHSVINEELEKLHSLQGSFALETVDVTVVLQAVVDLKTCAAKPGVHHSVVARLLEVMELSVGTITAFETSKLGIADAVLSYLLGANCGNNKENDASPNVSASGGLHGSFMSRFATDTTILGDMRTAHCLHQRCVKERLECFLKAAVARPFGVLALVENSVSTLPLESNFPLVESLLWTHRVTCRPPVKAVAACAQISPIVSLCCKKNHGNPEKGATGDDNKMNSTSTTNRRSSLSRPSENLRDYCPQGHKMQAVVEINHSGLCELCEQEVHSGFRCSPCDFHICMECYTNHEFNHERRGSVGSPLLNTEDATSASGVRVPFKRPRLAARAHLFASIGDIERFLRTGSSSTKNTDVAPAPKSALQNSDYFVQRIQTVMARRNEHLDPAMLRQEVRRILSSLFSHGPNAGSAAAGRAEAEVPPPSSESKRPEDSVKLGPKETKEMEQLLRSAMEERYVLYTKPGGCCAYQETLIGNIMQRALHMGMLDVVEQLEDCLLVVESSADASVKNIGTHAFDMLVEVQSGGQQQLPPIDLPSKIGSTESCLFHHFERDEDKYCSCGEQSRQEFDTLRSPNVLRKPTRLAENSEALLLILLHKVLHPLIKKRVLDLDSTAFVSAHFTTLVVRSLAASALRVAVLPPRLSVPRWVNFILTQAHFLLPLNVREHIARFFAYGARRALHDHIKVSHSSRSCSAIRVLPAEWARWATHKFRVDRNTLLHDAYTVLRKSADARFPISIEFKGDVGVGQGPTAHFYTLIAKQVRKARLELWRDNAASSRSDGEAELTPEPEGLYPRVTMVKHFPALSKVKTPQKLRDGGELLIDPFESFANCVVLEQERAQYYYLIGAALGRAFTDEMVFPLDLSPALAIFLRAGVPPPRVVLHRGVAADAATERPIDLMALTLDDVELMDNTLAASLRSMRALAAPMLVGLNIPFTLPGNDAFEMTAGGAKTSVSADNIYRYFLRATGALLYESVEFALRFIVRGFRDIVPCEAFAPLDARETMALLCGCRRDDTKPLWTLAEIKSILVAGHGYHNDSSQMRMLQNILAKRLTPPEQRAFLLFCTGCPRLPAGGVEALGAITVVRRSVLETLYGGGGYDSSTSEKEWRQHDSLPECDGMVSMRAADWPLPSVNTCFRYLKLPPYPTEELMYKKLQFSIAHGGETFELS